MDEYINRSLVIEHLDECKGSPPELCYTFAVIQAIQAFVKDMPAADVAPVVHGEWKYDKNATDWGIGGYVCSECKNKNNNLPCSRVKSVRMFSGARYCPNCGAKMDGGTP